MTIQYLVTIIFSIFMTGMNYNFAKETMEEGKHFLSIMFASFGVLWVLSVGITAMKLITSIGGN